MDNGLRCCAVARSGVRRSKNVTEFEHVAFVMKGGIVYKNTLAH